MTPDDGRYKKQFYLDNMQLFEYDQTDKKKQCTKKVVAREKRLLLHVRNRFEESGERDSNVQDWNTHMQIVSDKPAEKSSRPRKRSSTHSL